jgi:hypothetical protein
MKEFFFDTANLEYIEKTWDKISKFFRPEDVGGITTNPNAMYKENLDTIDKWVQRTDKLCKFVKDLNPFKGARPLVYIQGPNSEMTVDQIKQFLACFSEVSSKYPDTIGIKIPPFLPVLERVNELRHFFPNVTGIADCSTALNVLSHPAVIYASIIPGRMEEKGIDAKAHVGYVQQREPSFVGIGGYNKIITGSMRTLEGLKWVIEYGTVPTIGTRVWDDMFAKDKVEEFSDYWNSITATNFKFSPLISYDNTQLSIDFFNQMDEMGKKPYADFLKQ